MPIKTASRMPGFINILFTGTYVFLVVFCSCMHSVLPDDPQWGEAALRSTLFALMSGIVFVPIVMRLTARIRLAFKPVCLRTRQRLLIAAVLFGLTFSVLFCWYLAYFPGILSVDSYDQLNQVISGEYLNWHPVLHTLVFFAFPLKLTGGIIESIVLFQTALFALSITYAAYTFICIGHPFFALMTLFFTIFNPSFCHIALFPWKDCGLAIFAIPLAVHLLNICHAGDSWLARPLNLFAFCICAVFCTVFRHNGILFVGPVLIGVIMLVSIRRIRISVICCFFALLLLVHHVLYPALHVTSPDSRQLEILGLPMTVLGDVIVQEPESLDEDGQAFLYAVADQETWEKYHVSGNFNNIKWTGDINLNVINQTPLPDILRITAKAMLSAPRSALYGLLNLIDMVFTVGGPFDWRVSTSGHEPSPPLILSDLSAHLRSLAERYTHFVRNSTLEFVFDYLGLLNLIMVIALLSCYSLYNPRDYARLIPCCGLLIYNLGTMLLLTGPDVRFFLLNYTAFPIFLYIIFSERNLLHA